MPKVCSKVCILSAEEVEDWQANGTQPRCSDHDHMTAREANLEVYPWQTVNQTECHQLSKVVGQLRGRICIQRVRAYTWATVYDRPKNEIFRPLPDKPNTAGPGMPGQRLVQSAAPIGGKWNPPSNGYPERMIKQRKDELEYIESLGRHAASQHRPSADIHIP